MTVAKADLICAWCGWKKHTKENCYCTGGGKAGQQQHPKKGSPTDHALQAMQATTKSSTGSKTPTTAPVACIATTPSNPSTISYHIFMADSSAQSRMRNPTEVTQSAIMDLGASHHYFTAWELFTDYLPLMPQSGNSVKQGATFTIIGIGTVHASIMIGGQPTIIAFGNTLHTPDLAGNLISLSCIDTTGCTIQVKQGHMKVANKISDIVMIGIMGVNNLYEIQSKPVDPETLARLPQGDTIHDP